MQQSGVPRAGEVDGDAVEHPAWPRGQDGDAVGQEHRFRYGVGNQHGGRHLLLPDAEELDVEALAGHFVECTERLIEKQDPGTQDQGTGNGHPLSHPP